MKLYEPFSALVIFCLIFGLGLLAKTAHHLSDKPHHTGKEEFRGHDDILEEIPEEILGLITGKKEDSTPESPEKN